MIIYFPLLNQFMFSFHYNFDDHTPCEVQLGSHLFSFIWFWCIQARKEREARASEGGWTVVVHHKGRKKTTDSESGIAVGSVAQAAVMDKMGKKKSKEIGLNFYRFQRREAQRNGMLHLIDKFISIVFVQKSLLVHSWNM